MANILLCECFLHPGSSYCFFRLLIAVQSFIICTLYFFVGVAKMEIYLSLKLKQWRSTTTAKGCILVKPLLHLSSALVKGIVIY